MIEDPLADKGMPRGYDLLIRHLKDRAVKLGEWALGMVHDGWRAYDQSDLKAAQTVLDRATQLDRLDEDMEHASIAFLVLRQPAAVDLRTAAALLKITTHLDRVGRLGFDMARMTPDTADQDVSELADIRRLLQEMDEIAESMVRQALDALDRDQVDLARELFRRDDTMDRMHREASRMVLAALEKHPELARRLACDFLAARQFERIADNSCKVGEKTIYALTGMRRSEYLPRHPFRPYALETTTPPEPSRKSRNVSPARSTETKAP
jgi:phosphate transport system protein